MPSSTTTTVGPTPTSNPSALSSCAEGVGVHEEHRVAVLLGAGLQPDRRARGVVVRDCLALLEQRAFAVLTADAQAGLGDLGKDKNGDTPSVRATWPPERSRRAAAGLHSHRGSARPPSKFATRARAPAPNPAQCVHVHFRPPCVGEIDFVHKVATRPVSTLLRRSRIHQLLQTLLSRLNDTCSDAGVSSA